MNIVIHYVFNVKLFFLLFTGFILAILIGTLSHEIGHFLVAKSLGYNSSIYYNYTSFTSNSQIASQENFSWDNFLFILGGPIQTLITGTVGVILLLIYRNSFFLSEKLKFGQWLIIFLSLFWLRQSINMIGWMVSYFLYKKSITNLDELKLTNYLGISKTAILVPTGIIGIIILITIVFLFIPKSQRLTFILSGFLGGCAGFFFWIGWLGPLLMPIENK